MRGYDIAEIRSISAQLEADVSYLMDCRNTIAINNLINYPVLCVLWAYHPARKKWLSRLLAILFPIGIPVWLWGLHSQKNLKADMRRIAANSQKIIGVLREGMPQH